MYSGGVATNTNFIRTSGGVMEALRGRGDRHDNPKSNGVQYVTTACG